MSKLEQTPLPWSQCAITQYIKDAKGRNIINIVRAGLIRTADMNEFGSTVVRAVNSHDELLTGLRTIGQYLDEGQIVTARAMVADLLAKHGGEE